MNSERANVLQRLTLRSALALALVGAWTPVADAAPISAATPSYDQRIAEGAAKRFAIAYIDGGMSGANVAIDDCYKSVASPGSIDFCYVLDLTASWFDSAASSRMNFPPSLNNTVEQSNRRLRSSLYRFHLGAEATDKLRTHWAGVAHDNFPNVERLLQEEGARREKQLASIIDSKTELVVARNAARKVDNIYRTRGSTEDVLNYVLRCYARARREQSAKAIEFCFIVDVLRDELRQQQGESSQADDIGVRLEKAWAILKLKSGWRFEKAYRWRLLGSEAFAKLISSSSELGPITADAELGQPGALPQPAASTLQDKPPKIRAAFNAADILLVRAQIANCWKASTWPVKARASLKLLVTLDDEGRILGNPGILDAHELADPMSRGFAFAAVDAVAKCSPYRPANGDHALWSEMEVTFDLDGVFSSIRVAPRDKPKSGNLD